MKNNAVKQMIKGRIAHQIKHWTKQEHRVLMTSVSVTAVVIILRLLGILQSAELASLDQLFHLRPTEPADERIVIVEINENDLQQTGKWPIPDDVMAKLLLKLNSYQPRAIGLDIYRDLPTEPGQEEFVKAAQTIPNLIGIEKLKDKAGLGVAPPAVLSQRQQIGFNNVVVDSDGKVRRSLLYWHVGEKVHESLALKLALIYLKAEGINPQKAAINPNYLKLGKKVFPPFGPNGGSYVQADTKGYQILANFRRPGSFRTVSMTDVLAERVNPNWLKSRIVLIGSTAPSLQDFFYTPYSNSLMGSAQPMSGVEVHANFISQILSSTLSERPLITAWSEPVEWLWIFAWSSFSALLIWRLRTPKAKKAPLIYSSRAVILLFIIVSLSGSSYLAFLAGWWLPFVPSLLGILGSAAVITSHLAHLKEELKRSKEFLQTVIDTIPDPVFVKDKEHRWIILNQAYCNFLGYPLETLMQKSEYELFAQQEAETFWTQDELVFQTGETLENEEKLTDAFGITHWISTKKSLYKDAAGNLFLVGILRDITERKKEEQKLRESTAQLARNNRELKLSEDRLRYLAYHDPLTGLANRKHFHECLNQAIEWAGKNNELVGLMFLDLDGFKQVNDTLGHDVGDQLLKVVAQRLVGCLRSSDIVSRLGGDEFTVILPGITQPEYAAIVAEKILDTLSKVFLLNGQNVFVTVSIGISIYPLDGEGEDTLIKKADVAMYRAKQSGKNQHKFSAYV